MKPLLDLALAAHGGLSQWQDLTQLRMECSIGGTGEPAHTVATVDTREQSTRCEPFGDSSRRMLYTAGHVEIQHVDGTVLERHDDPRHVFAGHEHLAGYAIWNYLNLPFLLAQDGFRTEEIEPWTENGQTWRRLRVEFPDRITTHCRVQTFSFGTDDHLLRRHDYDAEVLNGLPLAHYSTDYRNFGGLIFPTRRWVVRRHPDNTTAAGPVLFTLDIQSVTLS